MGAVITSSAVFKGDVSDGTVVRAARAGVRCIENAGVDKSEIDLLVNVGVYRDQNVIEPAQACLIQREMEMNTNPLATTPASRTTFSFDILDGPCGFLHAVHVVDACLKNNALKRALIVSGDGHPSKRSVPGFPYCAIGAAVMIENGREGEGGFEQFAFDTSSDPDSGVQGYFNMNDCGDDGRNRIDVEVDSELINRTIPYCVDVVEKFVRENSIELRGARIISSQPGSGFGESIASAIGMDEGSAIDLYPEYGDPHSASLTLQYTIARDRGFFSDARSILFVAANPAMSVACASYSL